MRCQIEENSQEEERGQRWRNIGRCGGTVAGASWPFSYSIQRSSLVEDFAGTIESNFWC